MRATHSFGQLVVLALSLSHTVSAWKPWPNVVPEVDVLVVRQENEPSQTAPPATQQTTSRVVTRTNLNTGGISQTVTETGTARGNATRTSAPKKTMFNPQDPAGGVTMLTPAATAGYQLYKLKHEFVTFGWNYTNLQGTPTAVDVLVSCSKAAQTWTLTQNMTFATPGSYVWDLDKFQEDNIHSQLPTEQYTLIIHDSDSAITDAPEPGYLAPFTGLVFGLYEPKAPTPLGEWKCASCSGAMSNMEARALGGVLAMSAITVLSFTWFVGGFAALL
ncbi:hypothetical protein QBC34DRAFT_6572 [Podospora aff. communis PSN243]|uniref:DUF7137 domain-containing protein n=1 Tax=Podospora aff. communis PSN243 TaxID=3040156 RepID=A0AAV9H8X1_9PEZI|nr:hypothetical protein QBC34DRAFT_6572 [Podospora aff. communis PSN243]